VLQVGGDLDLVQEPLGAEDGRKLRVENLDGDLAIVLQVVGEVDRRHAAAAELALDAIAVGQSGLQAFKNVGHGSSKTRSYVRVDGWAGYKMLPRQAGSNERHQMLEECPGEN
jgi:hypothetical protein